MKRMTPIALGLLMLAGSFVGSAAPQVEAPPQTSKVERKNRAPVSKDVLRVTLPRATEATLSNGMTVLSMENDRLPFISLQYNASGAGPLFEPADLPGLAGITAQMLREGTKTKTSVQIAEQTAQLGASITTSSGFGSSSAVVSASGLSDNFEQWFALTNDILLNPAFPGDELNRLKQRMKAQLRQQRASPNFLSNEMFSHGVYGDHPAHVVSPTVQAIDGVTPEILANWHKARYSPQNTILGITGDVKAAELLPKLEKW